MQNHALNEVVESLQSTTQDIILLGDWNVPQIDWSFQKSKTSKNYFASKLLKACNNASLTQLIQEPTRLRRIGAENIHN